VPLASVLHIVGARPQFAKAAAVSRAVANLSQAGRHIVERLLHTGQHYDDEMSDVFFRELNMREPDWNLEVGSGTPAYQTAAAIQGVFEVLGEWRPDAVIVYGDTNATLAGAIAAMQRQLPLAHVEAGVRTNNLFHAEEMNRVVADRLSRWRFCCTLHNRATLEAEGLDDGSCFSGDTMLDNYRHFLPAMDAGVLEREKLHTGSFVLCTVHRAENVDHQYRLTDILDAVIQTQRDILPVVFPVHPRTRKAAEELGYSSRLVEAGVRLLEPIGFRSTQALLENCHLVLTDSGGLQREAYFAGRFSVIPWEYASWPELVEAGWASVGGVEKQVLVNRIAGAPGPRRVENNGLFGDGQAGKRIVETLMSDSA